MARPATARPMAPAASNVAFYPGVQFPASGPTDRSGRLCVFEPHCLVLWAVPAGRRLERVPAALSFVLRSQTTTRTSCRSRAPKYGLVAGCLCMCATHMWTGHRSGRQALSRHANAHVAERQSEQVPGAREDAARPHTNRQMLHPLVAGTDAPRGHALAAQRLETGRQRHRGMYYDNRRMDSGMRGRSSKRQHNAGLRRRRRWTHLDAREIHPLTVTRVG